MLNQLLRTFAFTFLYISTLIDKVLFLSRDLVPPTDPWKSILAFFFFFACVNQLLITSLCVVNSHLHSPAETMDLISNLPDEVLSHILSFLPTKHAASTSVLSKRWRDLIALVPLLEIDESEFLRPERDGITERFMDFVDRVLALQGDSRIERFLLDCKTGIDTDRVNRWVRNVLRRGVSVISLCTEFGDEYQLPPEVFVSKTLVSLEVKGGVDLGWLSRDGPVSLPVLKNLFLSSFAFSVEMLLPACPALETLDMESITWTSFNVAVSSETLKELFICSDGCFDNMWFPARVSFDTPRLVYLWYSDLVADDYPKVNMPKLVEARVDLRLDDDQFEQARLDGLVLEDDEDEVEDEDDVDNAFVRFRNVWKLFSGMRNVQKLYLTPNTLEVSLLTMLCSHFECFFRDSNSCDSYTEFLAHDLLHNQVLSLCSKSSFIQIGNKRFEILQAM